MNVFVYKLIFIRPELVFVSHSTYGGVVDGSSSQQRIGEAGVGFLHWIAVTAATQDQ